MNLTPKRLLGARDVRSLPKLRPTKQQPERNLSTSNAIGRRITITIIVMAAAVVVVVVVVVVAVVVV